jgi:prepilin-type N-terminal cleavage/methylation domain-containing protein
LSSARASLDHPAGPAGGCRGFSLVEVIVAGAILAIGACALVAALVNAMTLARVNRETAQATQAAREIVERLHGVPIKDVFRSFNTNPSDDPSGYRTAPGASFALAPRRRPEIERT